MNKPLYLQYGILCSLAALASGYTLLIPNANITNSALPRLTPSRETIASIIPVSVAPQSFATPNSKNITSSIIKTNLSPKSKLVTKFKYVRPKIADNGSPFPQNSGYIKGYPIQFKEGHSSVTVNNSKGSSDVFVKLLN